ncbi:MAG: glycosyltransferase [Candidatus Levybacteria bacterium]|nr:glycosyltransferase [Candidatus Levybacteria bacterium]
MMLSRRRKTFISVIVPSFRKENIIEESLVHVKIALDQIKYDYEIIVVVDGKIDKTFENAKKVKSSKIKVVGYEHNHGKGYAIRYGMARSKGNIVCFIDSGLDLNSKGLAILIEYLELHDADIVVGSKRHADSVVIYPWNRRIISFLSQVFIRFLFGLNVGDTQVGMKVFKRNVVEDVMPRLLVKKFAFDIEVLVVAYSLGYTKIIEAPIELNYDFRGSLLTKNIFNELIRTLWDTIAIFYRLKILGYYTDRNKRKWKYDPELEFKVNIG